MIVKAWRPRVQLYHSCTLTTAAWIKGALGEFGSSLAGEHDKHSDRSLQCLCLMWLCSHAVHPYINKIPTMSQTESCWPLKLYHAPRWRLETSGAPQDLMLGLAIFSITVSGTESGAECTSASLLMTPGSAVQLKGCPPEGPRQIWELHLLRCCTEVRTIPDVCREWIETSAVEKDLGALRDKKLDMS